MLRPVASGIWVVEHDFRMGPVDFGGRMTVLRLEDGTLLLYSPIAIGDALAAELRALGTVKHLVAPSGMHHLFMKDALTRFPEARVYAPRALQTKRPDLAVHTWLEGSSPWPGLRLIVLEGCPQVQECVLFHEASHTLVVCDLVFNIHEARGWFSPLLFRMLGVWKRLKQSPIWRFVFTADRAAAERSLEPLWEWPFERIVLCHGQIVEGQDLRARLAEAMPWMCPRRSAKQLKASNPPGESKATS